MDFINLSETLVSIAEKVELLPHRQGKYEDLGTHNKITKEAAEKFWNGKPEIFEQTKNSPLGNSNNEKIEWAMRMGSAALKLNKALHDTPDQMQWLEYDEAKGFAVCSDVANEVTEILTHASGWGNRLLNDCCTHFRDSVLQGDEALLMPIISDANNGLTKADGMLRLLRIGFARDELIAFLKSGGIHHSLSDEGENTPDLTIDDKRNMVAQAWVDTQKPPINWDKFTNSQIKQHLKTFYQTYREDNSDCPQDLFKKGIDDWFSHRRDYAVIPKQKAGRKSGGR